MATMYEMIMDLPLFKGVSKSQISLFLEKTNINFLNYDSGETIIGEGDSVTMVKFLISGSAIVKHRLESIPAKIVETCDVGTVFGADRLYGISTGYSYEAVAARKASIMEFSKEQYVNLLLSDRIYMLNFFNYLSLRAQRPVDSVSLYAGADLRSRLSLLVSIMTHPASRDICVEISDRQLADFGSMTEEEVVAWKDSTTRLGLIKCKDNMIKIMSRRGFLAHS